jgi:hypothetical protein
MRLLIGIISPTMDNQDTLPVWAKIEIASKKNKKIIN